MKKIEVIIVRCLIMVFSFYCFYNPSMVTFRGYSLAIDGIVVARALFLIFSMFNLVEIVKDMRQ